MSILIVLYVYFHDEVDEIVKSQLLTPSDHNQDYLKYKNFSDWTSIEKEQFFLSRESLYSNRRARIQQYCQAQDSTFSRTVRTLVHDDIDGISYCPIAKIASSSFCGHFLKLGRVKIF